MLIDLRGLGNIRGQVRLRLYVAKVNFIVYNPVLQV